MTYTAIKADPKFAKELEDIKIERIKNGKDKKIRTSRRLTLAIVRHSLWGKIRQSIINSELSDNKKAQFFATNILKFAALAFVIIFFLGLWAYSHALLTDALIGVNPQMAGNVNISIVADDTFGEMNRAMATGIKPLSITLIFGMILMMLLVAYFIRDDPPVMLIVDFFILVLSVIFSVYIANSFETLLTGYPFSSTLLSMKASSWIILNLPTVVTVIGILIMIVSYLGVVRRRGIGSRIIG